MIYSPGNAAKQWIFEQLHELASEKPIRILDCGCGDGKIWRTFLAAHPKITLVGIDTDQARIGRAKELYKDFEHVKFERSDVQKDARGEYDIVVALSMVEHVVDRQAFAAFVASNLKRGGTAFLNYDAGHFRSKNPKERIMVPVSQVLATLGIEGPYMKEVDTAAFIEQLKHAGLEIGHVRKGNVHTLKGFYRGAKNQAALMAWFRFEDALNEAYSPDQLDEFMWSTTVVAKKI